MAKTNPFTFIQRSALRSIQGDVADAARDRGYDCDGVHHGGDRCRYFSLLADQLMGWGVSLLLGLGG
jgi:hypothetical protein